ncbi:MAG: META domain-containing protein [Bacteroidetes bacterium]|jgi:heat shock protein HslJ|nr:META domain-containing protein [Bacteroidota bacterium]
MRIINRDILLISFLTFFLLGHTSCFSNQKSEEQNSSAKPVDMHTSEGSLDWMGNYIGVLPCADCIGIYTQLNIREGGRYERRSYYLGRSNDISTHKGAFEWDAAGNSIQLDEGDQFQVREMGLAKLDSDGEHIGGVLSDQYLLAKSDVGPLLGNPPESLLSRVWEVYRLIAEDEGFEKKFRPSFEIDKKGKLRGQAQCNRFETAIDFSVTQGFQPGKMAITKRACAKMKQEIKFIQAFDQSKYYFVFFDQLLLLDDNHNPLLIATGKD